MDSIIYQTRIENIISAAAQQSMDSLLIIEPVNREYYSGFTGSNGWLFFHDSAKYLITDGRYYQQAQKEAPLFELVKAEQSYEASQLNAFQNLMETLGYGIERIGFESNTMTVSLYKELLKLLPDRVFMPFDQYIESPRCRKDPFEIQTIEKAVLLAERALLNNLPHIKPGISERKLSALIQYEMITLGADGEAFDVIAASGANSAFPHASITDRVLAEGDTLVIDWGAKINGYHSDMTRTFFLGDPGSEMRKVYDIVLESQIKAIDAIKPGITAGELDETARSIIKKAGYGDYFSHGLGHGLGLKVHEEPKVKSGITTILEPGMIITVEPGIYIPDLGGVRIEDLILVTKDGCKILTSLPKDSPLLKV